MKKITDEEICKKLLEDAAPMNLEELGDEKLDELFALEVCGLTFNKKACAWMFGQWFTDSPNSTSNFDRVLPYLEKRGWRGTSNRCGSTSAATVSVTARAKDGVYDITAQSSDHPNDLCRAAVIALILAARKEKSR